MSDNADLSSFSAAIPGIPSPPPVRIYTAPFSPLAQTLMLVVVASEVVIAISTIFVSMFNVRVILRTKILHPNLSLILLVQSSTIGVYAGLEVVVCLFKLLAGSANQTSPTWFSAIDVFFLQFVNFLGHVLLIERAMATILVAHYENLTAPYFSVAWITFLTLVCIANSVYYYINVVQMGFVLVNAFTFIINYVALVLSFVEIIAIAKLGLYNASKFTQSTFYKKNVRLSNLSERYQLSENIRTGRQLGPTFLAHFFNMLFTNAMVNSSFAPSIALPTIIGGHFLMSIGNLVIVISTIGFHPALRFRSRQFFRRLFRHCIPSFQHSRRQSTPTIVAFNNRVECADSAKSNQISIIHQRRTAGSSTGERLSQFTPEQPLNVLGTDLLVLPVSSECDRHFQMLKKIWEEQQKIGKIRT